jgi:hypothetical protein
MSMTSKVNPTLRQEIVDYLGGTGYSSSNLGLVYTFGNRYSLRTIQEATQKLTREGILVVRRDVGGIYYRLNKNVPQKTAASLSASV